MRKWVYKAISILLSALVVLASADVAFAFPKKLPKLKGGKRPRITVPKTPSTRNLPPTSVARPNVATQVERATANAAKQVAKQAAATPAVTPVKAPKVATPATETPRKTIRGRATRTHQQLIDAFRQWTLDYPGTSPRKGIRENGKDLSLTELRKRAEQGDEQAAKLAYELELGQTVHSALKNWPKNGDEYRTLKTLYDENRNTRTRQQIIDAYKQWLSENPSTSPKTSITENGKKLSLTELRKRAEQGDAQAAKLADELELGKAIDHALQTWPQDSNEYKELKALYDANRNTKTRQQVIDAFKQWLADHPGTLPRCNIQENETPIPLPELRKRAEQGDAQAAKLAGELELGRNVNNALQRWPKDSPEYKELYTLYNENRKHVAKKTRQQIIDSFKQWIERHPNTSPRNSISENGKLVSLTELRKRAQQGDTQAAELANELELGNNVHNSLHYWPKNSPEYQELYNLYNANRNIAKRKTPQQIIAGFKQWIINYPGTSPRGGIKENGKFLSLTELRNRARQGDEHAAELANELELRININGFLQRFPKDSAEYQEIKILLDENRNQTANKPTDELYQDLVAHIKNYGHYPTRKESSLYTNIYNRLRYYESTMTADGKYADPWLQKIYELKTLIQNAPDGKFTLTPDGQGGYTLEIEEPITEELDVSAPQKVEELAPAVPSVHALHEHITEDIKNMILAVRDQAALERRDFYPWLRDMQQNHLDQIVNKDTSDALWALNRAISFDYKTGQNRRAVTYLLQTVNNYVGILGIDEELGYFNKIMYRGKLEPGMLPQADLFHVVAEQEGMSFDGTLAPQVEQLNKLAWQAYKQGQPLSVNFADDDNQDMLTALEIEKGVPIQTVKQDFQTAIQTLLPPGFEVRMGLHELGISGRDMTKFRKGHLHIHLERPATTEEMQDGFLTDVSISFDIKGLGRFVRQYNKNTRTVEPLTDKEIAQNYLTLFGSFLDQAAKDKLTELAR